MDFKYCNVCGTKAEIREVGDEGEMPFCPTCDKPLFPYFNTCILSLVVDEDGKFALIRQYNLPPNFYIGVAGYMKLGESLEEGTAREVEEEIGLPILGVRYVKSYPLAPRDQLMAGFVTYVKHEDFHLSGEVDEAKWFDEAEAAAVLFKGSIIEMLYLDFIADRQRYAL